MPDIPIYLSGPMPHGYGWCATCVVLYMGAVSADPNVQEFVKERYEEAKKDGATFCNIQLQEQDDLQLQPAITIGPSLHFPDYPPMPVCWTHVQGAVPQSTGQKPVGLGLYQPAQRRIRESNDGNIS